MYEILITSGLSRRLSFLKDEERVFRRSLAVLHEIHNEGTSIFNIPPCCSLELKDKRRGKSLVSRFVSAHSR